MDQADRMFDPGGRRMSDLIKRLREMHADIDMGAYYAPYEDPDWDVTEQAADRIEQLEAWRAEGMAVLDEWDEVHAMCPQPAHMLGLTKASVVKARITELEAALKRIESAGCTTPWHCDTAPRNMVCVVCEAKHTLEATDE